MSKPIVVAITGASGAVYARRLVQVLLDAEQTVHLLISPSGAVVFEQELGCRLNLDDFDPAELLATHRTFDRLHYFHHMDFMAPAASGSAKTGGMVICPCSGGTLSGVVTGASRNLIQRAAEVHLKENRKLILVPRETPLSLVHIQNMERAHVAGATIMPASPGWYHGVETLADLVDFIVGRILDHLDLDSSLIKRWGDE